MYVADFAKGIVSAPEPKIERDNLAKNECVCDLDSLLSLMRYRECELLKKLTEKTVSKPGKNQLYQTWMMEESDLIQDLAYIFGDRVCLEETIEKTRGQK